MPKDFLKHMYLFFKHYFDLDSRKESLTDLQYYSFRRNLTYVSLAGNEVKSVGEKIIADYLWEHGISFKYEKTFKWKNGMYRPDFYFEINNKKYVIEHWAINPDKETNSILENGINPKKYKEQIISKRKYWEFLAKKDPEYILIETHNDEVIGGRKAFENILKERLQSFGVVLTRLSDVEKINLLKKNHSRRITKLFLDFIKKAKKKNYTIVDLNAITSKPNYAETSDARTRTFHYYGKLIFEKYVETLANLRKSDFEDLLIESINEVRNSGSKAKFIDSTNQTVNLCDIEYLLIDEFQDFNELNFQLISEIKALNPKLKLFCVGDNWQAINGFAGSDTSFFEKFEELFPNADTLLISTNYRSESRIVELGNMLMFGEGAPAKSKHSIISGKVYQKYINYIEFDTFNEKDKVYLLNGDNDYIVSRYIKYIIEVLISNTGKHITILSRTNSIYGFDFQTLKKKILQITKRGYDSVIFETAKNMEFSTVHAYKGLEADIIVILDVLEGRFPLFHQDTVLFEIFGQNLPQAYKEEKRLFYVAISRPKEKLFIVTQSDRPSEFLSNIKFDSKEQ
jgi:DNA helicase-4